jgi:hypothetical protein
MIEIFGYIFDRLIACFTVKLFASTPIRLILYYAVNHNRQGPQHISIATTHINNRDFRCFGLSAINLLHLVKLTCFRPIADLF